MKFYLSKHMKHINFQMMSKLKNFVIVELRIEMTKKKFIKNNVIYSKLQRNIIKIEFNLNQKLKFQINSFRENKKKDRNFHDDVNNRFNKFFRNRNRDKDRKEREEDRFEDDRNNNQKENRRKDDRERKRKDCNKRRKDRKNDTSVIDSNTDFVEREKKQKKHDERQVKETCYKCEFTNHFIEICSKHEKKSKN